MNMLSVTEHGCLFPCRSVAVQYRRTGQLPQSRLSGVYAFLLGYNRALLANRNVNGVDSSDGREVAPPVRFPLSCSSIFNLIAVHVPIFVCV